MENDNIVLLKEIKEELNSIRADFENQKTVIPEIQLISETEVTELLKVTKVTLNNWRRDNILIEGEHYMRYGKCHKMFAKVLIILSLNSSKIIIIHFFVNIFSQIKVCSFILFVNLMVIKLVTSQVVRTPIPIYQSNIYILS